MLTDQQIQRFNKGSMVDSISITELMELCMDPNSDITIDGLRKMEYPNIDVLEEMCIHQLSGCDSYYKKFLIDDMKKNPSKYGREKMFDIISNNRLTREDLIDNNLLTESAYQHIIRYPKLEDEQRDLPMSRIEHPCSEHGNIDVYFLGVAGSGKTCALAGLISLAGQHGFRIDPRGHGCGGAYAMELFNYARTSMIPPSTDPNHICVIDAQVDDDNGHKHKVSLIEMTEEKFFEDIKVGTLGLLPNDNKKVLLFIIDLTKEDCAVTNDGVKFCIKQRIAVENIINILSRNESIIKNVTAIHFILTKSDALGDDIDYNTIRERLTTQGYTTLLSQIRRVCEMYYINKSMGFQVGLYPFSIGKFMPGDVYSFDETDSLKILRLLSYTPIHPCVYGPPSPGGLFGKFINWLNS